MSPVLLTVKAFLTLEPGLKPAIADLRDLCEIIKTCEMREILMKKKERARDNVKINYTRFAIRLFSHTIILSLIA